MSLDTGPAVSDDRGSSIHWCPQPQQLDGSGMSVTP
jgi:hypothetical protein